jgi:hypothetical protein
MVLFDLCSHGYEYEAGLCRRVVRKNPYVSEGHIASIFRVGEYARNKPARSCSQIFPDFLLGFSSTEKMGAICYSETSIFYLTARQYSPEEGTHLLSFVVTYIVEEMRVKHVEWQKHVA